MDNLKHTILNHPDHQVTMELTQAHGYPQCIIRPVAHKGHPVLAIGATEDQAIERAWQLFLQFKGIKEADSLPPFERKHTHDYAESHKFSDGDTTLVVVWRSKPDRIRLCVESIHRQDAAGWSLTQMPVDSFHCPLTQVIDQPWDLPRHLPLKPGELLMRYNSIRCLSGSAGYCIVSGDQIVRSIMTRRS